MHVKQTVSCSEAIDIALILSFEVMDGVLCIGSWLILEKGSSSVISDPLVEPYFLAFLFCYLSSGVVWCVGGFLWHPGTSLCKLVRLLISTNTTMGWDPLKVYVNAIQPADEVRGYNNSLDILDGLTLPIVNCLDG